MFIRRSAARVAVAAGALAVGVAPVALATARGGHPSPHAAVRTVQIVDNMFEPETLTIGRGTSVDFVWSDLNYNTHDVHLVTAPAGVAKGHFDSVEGSRHLHFKRLFTVPGTYAFTCTIHTGMSFHLTVRR